jgi:hypothetical protein
VSSLSVRGTDSAISRRPDRRAAAFRDIRTRRAHTPGNATAPRNCVNT